MSVRNVYFWDASPGGFSYVHSEILTPKNQCEQHRNYSSCDYCMLESRVSAYVTPLKTDNEAVNQIMLPF